MSQGVFDKLCVEEEAEENLFKRMQKAQQRKGCQSTFSRIAGFWARFSYRIHLANVEGCGVLGVCRMARGSESLVIRLEKFCSSVGVMM
jgi:hypothetical protein